MSATPSQIIFVTTQWPTPDQPNRAPFVKREVEALRAAGLTVDVYIYEGGWHPVRYLKAIRTFRNKLKNNNYDLVHGRFGQCGVVALAQRKLPVVIMYGGSDVEDTPRRNFWKNLLMRVVSRTVARLADEVIVVSDHLGKLLPRDDYHVISSALNMDLFKPLPQDECRRQLNLPQDKKLVLFAASDLSNKRKRFWLAQAVCEQVKADIDLDLVPMSGVSPEEVPVYMSACDALLLTSTNEGSPNVVKEALACNLPVVSTDVGDVRERIAHVPGCYLCADDDQDTIAHGLKTVLEYDQPFDGRSAVETLAATAFSQKLIGVYEKMLAGRRR